MRVGVNKPDCLLIACPSDHPFPNLPMLVRSLAREDPQEQGMATHSSILAWNGKD